MLRGPEPYSAPVQISIPGVIRVRVYVYTYQELLLASHSVQFSSSSGLVSSIPKPRLWKAAGRKYVDMAAFILTLAPARASFSALVLDSESGFLLLPKLTCLPQPHLTLSQQMSSVFFPKGLRPSDVFFTLCPWGPFPNYLPRDVGSLWCLQVLTPQQSVPYLNKHKPVALGSKTKF